MSNALVNLTKYLVTAVILFLLIFGALLFCLRYIEKKIIFYPTKGINIYPSQAGLNFEDINFNASDEVRLNGWFIPAQEAKYTILFCHGNAGNVSHRIEKIRFFNQLGYNVFIFDYRGYGKSKGSPSENGLYKDSKGAYAFLLSKGIVPSQIIGYGESIGGAVVIDLASKNKIGSLILESTFTSAKDMIRISFPYLPSWVFASQFDSIGKIISISCPKLIIHSINDEIVPFELSRKLYLAAPSPKSFLQIHGGHNSCFYESEELLRKEIFNFLKKLEYDSGKGKG